MSILYKECGSICLFTAQNGFECVPHASGLHSRVCGHLENVYWGVSKYLHMRVCACSYLTRTPRCMCKVM